ncbi:MAG: pantetheine-phosphate adenylyltransferase [Candidatus Avilachnospira sp.]|jgi:pantetheine-phosphate adenylyltransferase
MTKAIYPGSFDPITNGHTDIIERSAGMVDHLIIAVLKNNAKSPLFTVDERIEMIKKVTSHLKNVSVETFDGLLIDFAKKSGASVIVRGLRAVTDFEYELQMAQTNRVLAPSVDTIFLTTNLKYSYLSSSIVKEIAGYGGDISEFVSPYVEKMMKEKLKGRDTV